MSAPLDVVVVAGLSKVNDELLTIAAMLVLGRIPGPETSVPFRRSE